MQLRPLFLLLLGTLLSFTLSGCIKENSKDIGWTLGSAHPSEILAVSQAWNWLNIGIAGVLVAGGVLTVAGTIAVLIYLKASQRKLKPSRPASVSKTINRVASATKAKEAKSFQQRAPAQKSQPQTPKRPLQKLPSKPKTRQLNGFLPKAVQRDPIAAIGIRDYLEQINKQVFQGNGMITQTSGQIKLGWSDLGDHIIDHEIIIKALDPHTFEINGKPIPATPDQIKQGLVSCLKRLNRL